MIYTVLQFSGILFFRFFCAFLPEKRFYYCWRCASRSRAHRVTPNGQSSSSTSSSSFACRPLNATSRWVSTGDNLWDSICVFLFLFAWHFHRMLDTFRNRQWPFTAGNLQYSSQSQSHSFLSHLRPRLWSAYHFRPFGVCVWPPSEALSQPNGTLIACARRHQPEWERHRHRWQTRIVNTKKN